MNQVIAAIDNQRGLADDHGIPWQGQIPKDSQYFRAQTSSGVILMGYRTYQEFKEPLHDWPNFVSCRAGTPALREGFEAVEDLDRFYDEHVADLVWNIGGAGLFVKTMSFAEKLYLTQLDADFHCSKFFPPFTAEFDLESVRAQSENGISFQFQVWRRTNNRPTGPAAA